MLRLGQIPIALFLPLTALAQGTWIGAGLKGEAPGPWSWSAQVESRQLPAHHETAFLDLSVARTWGDHFEADLQWRSALEHGASNYVPEHRLALRLTGTTGPFAARFMAQEARPYLVAPDWATGPQGRVALRARLGYTGPWWGAVRFGVSSEAFWRGTHQNLAYAQLRNRLDADLRLSKSDRITLGYQLEISATGQPDHVVRLGFSHDLGEWHPFADRKERRRRAAIPAARSFDATGTPIVTAGRSAQLPVCRAGQVFLSEVHANGTPADYIELHNPTAEDCRLTGWRFDDAAVLEDWLGTDEVVPAYGCWVAFSEGPGGFSSGLSADGEAVYLAAPGGEPEKVTLRPNNSKDAETFDKSGGSALLPPSIGRYFPPGE